MLEQLQKIDQLGLAVDEAFYSWAIRSCERLRAIPSVRLLLKFCHCLSALLGRVLCFRTLVAYWGRATNWLNEWVAEFEAIAQLDLKMPLGVLETNRKRYHYYQSLQDQILPINWDPSTCLKQDLAEAMTLRKYRNHLLDVLEWASQSADKQRIIILEGEPARNLQAMDDLKKIWRLLVKEEKRLSEELKNYPMQSFIQETSSPGSLLD